jgi:hypothetical protein
VLPEVIDGFATVRNVQSGVVATVPLCCLWSSIGLVGIGAKSKTHHSAVIQSFLEDVQKIPNPLEKKSHQPLLSFSDLAPKFTKVEWTKGKRMLSGNTDGSKVPNITSERSVPLPKQNPTIEVALPLKKTAPVELASTSTTKVVTPLVAPVIAKPGTVLRKVFRFGIFFILF